MYNECIQLDEFEDKWTPMELPSVYAINLSIVSVPPALLFIYVFIFSIIIICDKNTSHTRHLLSHF